MSKRGSKSANFIGGKDWKNGRVKNDLNKKLKQLRDTNHKTFLESKFKNAMAYFGITDKDNNAITVKREILKEINKNRQALFFKNIELFKNFADKNNIEFTIEKYFDDKYYLKDYSEILDEEFGFSNFSKKELMKIKISAKKSKTNVLLKRYVIKAHIEYLIFQKEQII